MRSVPPTTLQVDLSNAGNGSLVGAAHASAEKMLSGVNTAMRKHENHFTGDPWVFTGLKDN